MDLIKAVYRPLAENESHKCGRDDCHENAVVLVTDINKDGTRGLQCAFCDIHFGAFANNGLLDLSREREPL